jgi:hypothetical protein
MSNAAAAAADGAEGDEVPDVPLQVRVLVKAS